MEKEGIHTRPLQPDVSYIISFYDLPYVSPFQMIKCDSLLCVKMTVPFPYSSDPSFLDPIPSPPPFLPPIYSPSLSAPLLSTLLTLNRGIPDLIPPRFA